jgi:hypothetical protein
MYRKIFFSHTWSGISPGPCNSSVQRSTRVVNLAILPPWYPRFCPQAPTPSSSFRMTNGQVPSTISIYFLLLTSAKSFMSRCGRMSVVHDIYFLHNINSFVPYNPIITGCCGQLASFCSRISIPTFQFPFRTLSYLNLRGTPEIHLHVIFFVRHLRVVSTVAP